jgi:hypothetical protein
MTHDGCDEMRSCFSMRLRLRLAPYQCQEEAWFQLRLWLLSSTTESGTPTTIEYCIAASLAVGFSGFTPTLIGEHVLNVPAGGWHYATASGFEAPGTL